MKQKVFYPGIKQAIWFLILAWIIAFLLEILVLIIQSFIKVPFDEHPVFHALFNIIWLFLVLLWGFKKTKAPFEEVFPLKSFDTSLLLPVIITIFGIVILLSEADNIFRTFLPMPEKLAEFFRDYLAGEKSFLGSFFLLVIVAPVTEEALFRGLVLRGFLIRYSVRKAILVSALLFGMFHLLPWQIFSGFIAGILFAWLFIKTGSLLPCIIAHAVSNSVPSILILTKFRIPGFTGDMTTVEHQPLWFDFIGLVLAAAGLYWLVRIFKKNDSKEPAPENINP